MMQEDNGQPLPPELDWNNMREGIYNKIESLAPEYTPEKKRRPSKRDKRLVFILLLVLTLGSFFAYQITRDYQAVEDSSLVPSVKVDEAIHRPENLEEIVRKNTRTNSAPKATQPSKHLNSKNRSSSNNSPTAAREAQNAVGAREHFNQPSRQPAPVLQTPAKDFSGEEASKSENNAVGPKATTAPTAQTSPDAHAHDTGMKLLTSDKLSRIPFEKENPLVQISLQKTVSTLQKKGRIPNQLILEGGLTFWSEGYGNDTPERATYEQPQTSFQLQANYKKSLANNYYIMAGVQYQQLESRFSYNNTIQDYPIVLSDTIIQIRNNIITGEQTIIRGDVEQFVEADRRVIHHNTTSLFSGSFAIGKSWQLKAFQTDIYLGGVLNSLVHNQGKTLRQGTIIEYDGAANSLFDNQWTVAGISGARLHYSINQKISLTAAMQVQKSLLNWGVQGQSRFHPTTVSLLLGVGYSLHTPFGHQR